MATLMVLTGSVIGFFCGLFGWIALEFTLLSAFGIYLAVAFGFVALAVLACMMRGTSAPSPMRTVEH